MLPRLRIGYLLPVLTFMTASSLPDPAAAITAELARKCNALIAKQFPPREPGNPAAGSAKGSGRDQYTYFNKCVANNGKMDDPAAPAK